MARFSRQKILLLLSGVLLIGVCFGALITIKFNMMPASQAEDKDRQEAQQITNDVDLRTAFIKVADKVGPAVVSISSERTSNIPQRRHFSQGPGMSPFGDDFFDQFFKDFFGNIPEREYKQEGLGSGVIVDPDGFILTNEHVVSGADKITVNLPDGRSFNATVKGTDPRSDLAVIKIEAKSLPFAELGDSDMSQTGEWVVAIGNPFGFAVNNPKPTVTVGVISAIHRSLPGMFGKRSYLDLIQTDAAINPGNSGGPLCDLSGKVIGINAAIVSTTGGYQGIGFAIPSNVANNIIGDLIKGKKIIYGWFGVSVQSMTEELASYFGLSTKEGVLVAGVTKEGPAKKADIKSGDIIMNIDNEKIKTVRDVLKAVGSKKPGEKVNVTVLRDKKEIVIPVIVAERPASADQTQEEDAKPEAKEDILWRGIKVIDITPELAQRYSIDDTAGVIISAVDPASPAAEAGLRRGDIIREINKAPISNKAKFNSVVSPLKGDVLLKTDKGYTIVKEPKKE